MSFDCCNALGIKGFEFSSGASAGRGTEVRVDKGDPSRSVKERCLDNMLG